MNPPNYILVIRLSAMGDVAMTVPVLRVVALTYPEVRMTVVSRAFFKPLFNDIPNVQFLEADVYGSHKGINGLLRLAKECKATGIDAVADLHNVIRSKVVTKKLKWHGMTVATVDKGRKEKKALVTKGGKTIIQLKSTHQRYADVFAKLGLPISLINHQFPKPRTLTPRLLNIVGTHTKKIIGIAPFAAYDSKTYPISLLKQVIAKMDATHQYELFLFGGGKKEIEILSAIEKEFESVTNIAGQLTFDEELALLSNIDLMVAMDSGNGHLAANFGIPVLTLWGVTHPFAGFTPFGQPDGNQLTADRTKFPFIPTSIYGNKFPEGYDKSMETIAPETIFEKMLSILD